MTSGRTTRDRARGLRSAALAAALVLGTGAARAFDLPELMALLARQRSGEATYREQRFVTGFDAPLTASGQLAFRSPDALMRRQLRPREETMQVAGNTLTLTRDGRSRSFALDSVPEMLPLVESMRGTLGGDRAVLERHFAPSLQGSPERWTLELRPLDARVAALVASVRIAGRRGVLVSVETVLADGDRSVMDIDAAPAAASAP